jgi:hypothetical protein
MSGNAIGRANSSAFIPLAPQQAKLLAQRLTKQLKGSGESASGIAYSSILEMVAHACGHRDWNTMSATPVPHRELTMADLPAEIQNMVKQGHGDYIFCRSINPDNPVVFYSWQLLSDVGAVIEADDYFKEVSADDSKVTIGTVTDEFRKLTAEEYDAQSMALHDDLIFDLWFKYGAKAIDRAEGADS